MREFFSMLVRRWLAAARSLFADMRWGYRSDGLRGLLFEMEVWAKSFRALALGWPLIMNECVACTRESEGILAAWREGVSPHAYVRRQCESLGLPLGSPEHAACLAWAVSFINFMEARRAS